MQLSISLLGLIAKLSASTGTDVIKQQDRYAPSPTVKHEGTFFKLSMCL
jgi:hypothetical protein